MHTLLLFLGVTTMVVAQQADAGVAPQQQRIRGASTLVQGNPLDVGNAWFDRGDEQMPLNRNIETTTPQTTSFTTPQAAPLTTPYLRPPPSRPLPLDHPLLAPKHANADDPPYIPEQVNLAPHNTTENGKRYFYKVTYTTSYTDGLSQVRWGDSPISLSSTAVGAAPPKVYSNINWYRKSDGSNNQGSYNNATNLYTSFYTHSVVFGPLDPDTFYYYQVGPTDKTTRFEEVWSFTTPPSVGAGQQLKLAVVGDLGQTEDSAKTIEMLRDRIKGDKVPLLEFVGDISYADGYHPRWDTYGRLAEDMHARVATLLTGGNHEVEDGEAWQAYMHRYPMPFQATSNTQLWYSFESGPVHFVTLCSYAETDPDSLQYQWLAADLARVDRARTPWVIVNMHAPWYNSNTSHKNEQEPMRKAMEPLFVKYGVDIIFSGHVHAYERTSPVVDYKSVDCGPVHIVIGDGGNREGASREWNKQVPSWSAFRESSFGYGYLHIKSSAKAEWKWHRNQDATAVIADATLIKRAKCPSFE